MICLQTWRFRDGNSKKSGLILVCYMLGQFCKLGGSEMANLEVPRWESQKFMLDPGLLHAWPVWQTWRWSRLSFHTSLHLAAGQPANKLLYFTNIIHSLQKLWCFGCCERWQYWRYCGHRWYWTDFDIDSMISNVVDIADSVILYLTACGYCWTLTIIVVENWRRRKRLDWRLKTEHRTLLIIEWVKISFLTQCWLVNKIMKVNLSDHDERERSCESWKGK